MRKIIIGSFIFAGLAAVACSTTDTNVNRPSNRAGNQSALSSAANTVGSAANTVANTVSNTAAAVTTPAADTFLKEAAQGGMAEVEMGNLASKKAQNPEVKKFGQMMVTDHSAANSELKALATKKNIPIPTDVGSHRSTIDKLSSSTGADFDKAYVDLMVDDHEDDVAAFEKQASSAADPDVKSFAAKTLPVLKKHLEAIKAIQAKIK